MIRSALALVARFVVGGLLAWAGTVKLLEPDPLVDAFDWVGPALGIAPSTLEIARGILPRLEIVVGLCLVSGLYLRPALLVAGTLLALFAGVLAAGSLQRGGIGACGCFGARVLDSGGPVFWIGRNVFLAALAFAAARWGSGAWSLDGATARPDDVAQTPGMLADGGGGA